MNAELTEQEKLDLARLAEMAEEDIDTVDIPEAPAENWRYAVRPAAAVTLDKDVLEWFKVHSGEQNYRRDINAILRQHAFGHAEQRG